MTKPRYLTPTPRAVLEASAQILGSQSAAAMALADADSILVEKLGKSCRGEGCPRADLCRRYMDAQHVQTPTYFTMSPVQFDGSCTEFIANGWVRKDPNRCSGAHPPPRCTWQCCIEEDA